MQYFPGRPSVKSALKAVDGWLQEQSTEIEYSDFRDVLDSVVQVSLKTCLWFSYILTRVLKQYMDFNTDVWNSQASFEQVVVNTLMYIFLHLDLGHGVRVLAYRQYFINKNMRCMQKLLFLTSNATCINVIVYTVEQEYYNVEFTYLYTIHTVD